MGLFHLRLGLLIDFPGAAGTMDDHLALPVQELIFQEIHLLQGLIQPGLHLAIRRHLHQADLVGVGDAPQRGHHRQAGKMSQQPGQIEAGDEFLNILGREHDGPVIPEGHEIGMALFDVQGRGGQGALGQHEEAFEAGPHQLGHDFGKKPPTLGGGEGNGQGPAGAGHPQQLFGGHLLRGIVFVHQDVGVPVGIGLGHGIERVARRGDGETDIKEGIFPGGQLAHNHARQGPAHLQVIVAGVGGRPLGGRGELGFGLGKPLGFLIGPAHGFQVLLRELFILFHRPGKAGGQGRQIGLEVYRQAQDFQGPHHGRHRHQVGYHPAGAGHPGHNPVHVGGDHPGLGQGQDFGDLMQLLLLEGAVRGLKPPPAHHLPGLPRRRRLGPGHRLAGVFVITSQQFLVDRLRRPGGIDNEITPGMEVVVKHIRLGLQVAVVGDREDIKGKARQGVLALDRPGGDESPGKNRGAALGGPELPGHAGPGPFGGEVLGEQAVEGDAPFPGQGGHSQGKIPQSFEAGAKLAPGRRRRRPRFPGKNAALGLKIPDQLFFQDILRNLGLFGQRPFIDEAVQQAVEFRLPGGGHRLRAATRGAKELQGLRRGQQFDPGQSRLAAGGPGGLQGLGFRGPKFVPGHHILQHVILTQDGLQKIAPEGWAKLGFELPLVIEQEVVRKLLQHLAVPTPLFLKVLEKFGGIFFRFPHQAVFQVNLAIEVITEAFQLGNDGPDRGADGLPVARDRVATDEGTITGVLGKPEIDGLRLRGPFPPVLMAVHGVEGRHPFPQAAHKGDLRQEAGVGHHPGQTIRVCPEELAGLRAGGDIPADRRASQAVGFRPELPHHLFVSRMSAAHQDPGELRRQVDELPLDPLVAHQQAPQGRGQGAHAHHGGGGTLPPGIGIDLGVGDIDEMEHLGFLVFDQEGPLPEGVQQGRQTDHRTAVAALAHHITPAAGQDPPGHGPGLGHGRGFPKGQAAAEHGAAAFHLLGHFVDFI